tara:strand:- start:2668 stop:3381 length:714 start_codon:yes stop_codon:yes gene_type:complete
MIKIYNFIRFFLAVILIGCMLSFGSNRIDNSYCFLSDIKIDTNHNKFITKDIIIDYLKEFDLNPDSLLFSSISFYKIEKLLLGHPSVKDVVVYSDMNGNVYIELEQRNPILRVQNIDESYYIDEDGKKMLLSKKHTSRVLVVSGDISSVGESELFKFVMSILENKFLENQIVQIEIKNSELLLHCREGENILFGQIKDVKEKFKKLLLYYNKGNINNQSYSLINLKYKNQIVCIKNN